MTLPIPQGLINPQPGQAIAAIVTQINERLHACMQQHRTELLAIDEGLLPLWDVINQLVTAGGKRYRPAFVWWGYIAAGGQPHWDVLGPATAVEMLHTFALIHDDIMDRASTRRGVTTSHVAMAALHNKNGWLGDSTWFGQSSAILAGDLTAIWADELFVAPSLPASHVTLGRHVFTTLRSEVMVGQWLDIQLAALPHATPAHSEKVALLKSGRYSVSRPLQLGAALAGVQDGEILQALLAYGDALGVAFQLRDDMLGVFGESDQTGKSVGSDIYEGKRTVLVLTALEAANANQRDVITAALGNQDATLQQVDAVRQVLVDTGAKDKVEAHIGLLAETCHKAVQHIPDPTKRVLVELAHEAINRDY